MARLLALGLGAVTVCFLNAPAPWNKWSSGVGQKQGAYSISETSLAILLTSCTLPGFVGVQPLEINKRWKEKVKVGGKKAQLKIFTDFLGTWADLRWHPDSQPLIKHDMNYLWEPVGCFLWPIPWSEIPRQDLTLPRSRYTCPPHWFLEGQLLSSLTNFPAAHVTHRKLLCLWQATWWECS